MISLCALAMLISGIVAWRITCRLKLALGGEPEATARIVARTPAT